MDKKYFNVGNLKCYRNWDCEGEIVMVNPKTIDRYNEIKDEQFDFEKHGAFFAFSQEQFDEKKQELIKKGYLKESDKLYRGKIGMIGPKEAMIAFEKFADEQAAKIAKECDPQEVYIYEWNNHECMFGNEEPAYSLIVAYFGDDAASKIRRF